MGFVALLFYKMGKMILAQAQLIGMTIIMAGIMSAVGKSFNPRMRKPVAIMRKPPQALKSLIMSGVVRGRINLASRKRMKKMINCGIAIADTT